MIYYEDSMPYAEAFFSRLGLPCRAFHGPTITAADIHDATMLLVRSTTKVNQALIGQCEHLKFVATATAGFNHLDLVYLQQRGIPVYVAAGCNAVAVAEYVLSALFACNAAMDWDWTQKTVGIVGAGQVGTALSVRLDALGVRYLLCDPPKQLQGDPRPLLSLDEIMQCDIISLHTPLVKAGEYPTLHMFDAQRLAQLTPQQLLINACRGEVIDNLALLQLLQQGQRLNLVLDVWEHEPDINLALIPHMLLSTAHIAGHSIEGKARGTEMVYQAACQQLGIEPTLSLTDCLPAPANSCLHVGENQYSLAQLVWQVYDVRSDSAQFRQQVQSGKDFEYIRKHYPIRREFAAYQVMTGNSALSQALYNLGFQPAR